MRARYMTLVMLLLVAAAPSWLTAQKTSKYTLTPTPDPSSKSNCYIPENLDDAMAEMDRMLTQEFKNQIRNTPLYDFRMAHYRHGLGLWMRNNWLLWAGGRLAKYLNSIGVNDPEEMSVVLLEAYWSHLNDLPFSLPIMQARNDSMRKELAFPQSWICPLHKKGLRRDVALIEYPTIDTVRITMLARCKKREWWAHRTETAWVPADRDSVERAQKQALERQKRLHGDQ